MLLLGLSFFVLSSNHKKNVLDEIYFLVITGFLIAFSQGIEVDNSNENKGLVKQFLWS
jgi:hypothetical protein